MLITNVHKYIADLQAQLDELKKKDTLLIDLILELIKARNEKRQIFVMGNGGSGSTASHWANDFNKGMNYANHQNDTRFKMICLNDNIPTMLAIANDASYDDIFVEQLKNFLQPGDLVLGISGSGNSKNVIKAMQYANENNAITYAIVGFNGGKLKETAKKSFHLETNNMGIFEDLSLIIDHIIFDCYKHITFN